MSILEECNGQIITLMDLMREETRLLRSGQLEALPKLIDAKSQRVTILEQLLKNLDDKNYYNSLLRNLSAINKISRDNGRLLQSTINGIHSAQERLINLQRQTSQMNTYNSQGQTTKIRAFQPSKEILV